MSIEEWHLSNWSVAWLWEIFLVTWFGSTQTTLGCPIPEHGLYKKNRWASHKKQTNKNHSSKIFASVPVPDVGLEFLPWLPSIMGSNFKLKITLFPLKVKEKNTTKIDFLYNIFLLLYTLSQHFQKTTIKYDKTRYNMTRQRLSYRGCTKQPKMRKSPKNIQMSQRHTCSHC